MKQSANHQEMYRVNKPYPKIRVMEKNPYYAKEILDNVGGCVSEIGAVSLYFYNHLRTAEYEDIALIFHQVSIVEMHHLEIFGRLSLLLGADPRLWTMRGERMAYWNGSRLPYCHNLRDILAHAVADEEKAIEKYSRQAGQIQDAGIVANMNRILEDEHLHISVFEDLLKKYC